MAVVEFARNVAGLEQAHSMEYDPNTETPVIYLMREWYDYQTQTIQRRDEESDLGGTMRLGAYPCVLEENTHAFSAYGQKEIFERHRHRYEFNNEYRDVLGSKGLMFTGQSPDKELVEIIEIEDHPWFLGCQFHPEFRSRPMDPHPLFRDFIKSSLEFATRQGRSELI
jgi:CTP synthase